MGIFSKSPIGEIAKTIGDTIDDMHYSGEEKADMKMKFAKIVADANLAQMEVNKQEAKNGQLFVSGWRPSVGWTCAAALAWTFVLSPVLQSIVYYIGQFSDIDIDMSGLPVFDLATLMPVLLGMLGLGGLRTYEKVNSVARSSMGEQSLVERAVQSSKAVFKKGPPRDGT